MNPQDKNNPFKKYLSSFSDLVFYLFLPSAFAETKPYVVPSPPDMLKQRVELIDPQGSLSLTEALSLALLHNPTLQDYAWEIRISDVKTLRAGLLPNPELGFEAENFLGSGQQRDFDQTGTTVSIRQLFELGGKREKRVAHRLGEIDSLDLLGAPTYFIPKWLEALANFSAECCQN